LLIAAFTNDRLGDDIRLWHFSDIAFVLEDAR